MNREIKFRGKRIDKNEWLYGDLVENRFILDGYCEDYDIYFDVKEGIIDGRLLEVNPKTIGQYTGLKDKNGVEVYEGDIVRIVYDNIEHIYQIIFDKEELDFKATNGEINYGGNFQYLGCCEEIEVIGNIYENEVD